jgi:hypothetical protein
MIAIFYHTGHWSYRTWQNSDKRSSLIVESVGDEAKMFGNVGTSWPESSVGALAVATEIGLVTIS